ncbi:hypothetical protein EXIGLDRAFT_774873 [Exidia glandulosa HHB12029]|uniref:Uncharacterized protein n=1 Tax=Exidia glandulosa HHB12029 TaxID=1314781 RepID=A0A165E676_EXIGL|nr:hypothetical protein EXIGLDRAFT_774873 [Exidia glandulosa HHB12029]
MSDSVVHNTYAETITFCSGALGSFLYGIFAILSFLAFRGLWLHRRDEGRAARYLALYFFALFGASTTFMAASMHYIVNMFIDYVFYAPQKVTANLLTDGHTTELKIASVAFVVINALSSGFLLYRSASRSGFKAVICIPAVVISTVSTIFSILTVAHLSNPTSFPFATIYISLSNALHLMLFLLSTCQLRLSTPGVGCVSMAVESTSLLSLSSIAFVASYASRDAVFNIFFAIQGQIMCIVPVSLILFASAPDEESVPDAGSGAVSAPQSLHVVVSEKTRSDSAKRTLSQHEHEHDGEDIEIIALDHESSQETRPRSALVSLDGAMPV